MIHKQRRTKQRRTKQGRTNQRRTKQRGTKQRRTKQNNHVNSTYKKRIKRRKIYNKNGGAFSADSGGFDPDPKVSIKQIINTEKQRSVPKPTKIQTVSARIPDEYCSKMYAVDFVPLLKINSDDVLNGDLIHEKITKKQFFGVDVIFDFIPEYIKNKGICKKDEEKGHYILDLEIRRGDRVIVLDSSDIYGKAGTWYLGFNLTRNKWGYFPSNYVRLISQ